MNSLFRFLAGLTLVLMLSEKSFSQCVVINEVLINGPGKCDGSCNPDTEEWIELYNTCSSPADIGCFVLTDGEFTVTIPQGTAIPANGYYVIGSNGSIGTGTVDLNISNCNCTSGVKIGTLTNPNDQIILADKDGNVQNGLIWGGGQNLPLNITATPSAGGCPQTTVSATSSSSFFEVLSATGGNGCTIARVCDGSKSWEERCNSTISMGTTNGALPLIKFSASKTTICKEECLSYIDSTVGATSWKWTFSGADSTTSVLSSPSNICYNGNGNYDVTLTVTTGCGKDSSTKTSYIKVGGSGQIPVVTALRDTICDGTPTTLSVTDSLGVLQWQSSAQQSNFSDINSEKNKDLFSFPSQTTYYRIYVTTNGICTDTSAPYKIVVNPSPVADYSFNAVAGNNAQLEFNSSASVGASVFDWNFGDGGRSADPNPVHTFAKDTFYHVCLTALNGSNCSFTVCKDIKITFTGVTEDLNVHNKVRVYPNPYSDYFFIEADRVMESTEVYDVLGRNIFTLNNPNKTNAPIMINLPSLSQGVYYLKIKFTDAEIVRTLVRW